MSRSRDKQYRLWRAKVIRRDKCCVICSSRYRRAAHHLNSWQYFPDDRYDTDNGVCLCGKCHSAFHTMFKRSYRVKCMKRDWDDFVDLVRYVSKLNLSS